MAETIVKAAAANPLLAAYKADRAQNGAWLPGWDDRPRGWERHLLADRFSWAVPNDAALDAIAALSPIVEIGAGRGYWASLLIARGADVVAYDAHLTKGRKTMRRAGLILLPLLLAACSDTTAPEPQQPTLRLYATMAEALADTITWYIAQGDPYDHRYDAADNCVVRRISQPGWYPAGPAEIRGGGVTLGTRSDGSGPGLIGDGTRWSRPLSLAATDLLFAPRGYAFRRDQWGEFWGAVYGTFRNRETGAIAYGADSFRCVRSGAE